MELRVWLQFWQHGIIRFWSDVHAVANSVIAVQYVFWTSDSDESSHHSSAHSSWGCTIKLPYVATTCAVFVLTSPLESFICTLTNVADILLSAATMFIALAVAKHKQYIGRLEYNASNRDQCLRPWWRTYKLLFARWLQILSLKWNTITSRIVRLAKHSRRLIKPILRQHDAIRLKLTDANIQH